MSKAREQLAATLINHVHVIEQSIATGRRSRRPTSKRYAEAAVLDFANASAFNEVLKSFIAFNSKHFIENLRFSIDKQVGEFPGLKATWSPKILIRGLGGKLVAENIDFNLAAAVVQALMFSRQSAEITSALELSGSITPHENSHTAIDFLIPAFKNAPFCNLAREQEDFTKIFAAKLLVMRALTHVIPSLNEAQRAEIINGRSNILINCESDQASARPISFSLEETDAARAQRLARERLEELRRRRKMSINSVTVESGHIAYDVSPLISPDEHQQLTVSTEALFGW